MSAFDDWLGRLREVLDGYPEAHGQPIADLSWADVRALVQRYDEMAKKHEAAALTGTSRGAAMTDWTARARQVERTLDLIDSEQGVISRVAGLVALAAEAYQAGLAAKWGIGSPLALNAFLANLTDVERITFDELVRQAHAAGVAEERATSERLRNALRLAVEGIRRFAPSSVAPDDDVEGWAANEIIAQIAVALRAERRE